MKNFRIFAAIAAFAIISASSAFAQPNKQNWHEKMMSEKIGYLTSELELTPEEAQAFWPVYNKIAEKNREQNMAVGKAYKALTQALKEGTASDKEIDRLLDEYLAAKQAQKENGKNDVAQYRKVLPGKKVAKLYIAEENYRRHQINRMRPQHGPQGPKVEGRGPKGPQVDGRGPRPQANK
jgi:Spy/CpxP family protein refolding chaperone